jgi:penicillin-binding protein 1A
MAGIKSQLTIRDNKRWPAKSQSEISFRSLARWHAFEAKTARGSPSIKFRAKYLASFAFGLALLVVFILYSIATLPLTGGLQVEATQSALTFEGAQGDVLATRGVFKGDKLTAADLSPHSAQAIISIEDRRFYQHHGVDLWGRGMSRKR